MSKTIALGMALLVALSGSAVALVTTKSVTGGSTLPVPFHLPDSANTASVTLADGRRLELRGEDGSLVVGGHDVLTLAGPRRFASLTVMPTGQVLIWGGIDNDGRLIETGEWFEPSTGALVTTGRLGLPVRAGHTLNVLSDGTLAMTGGWGQGNVPAYDVALWRPLDRHLDLVAGDAAHARISARASLLADGTLQIHGGVDEIGRPVHGDWLFGKADGQAAKAHGIAASYPSRDKSGASPIGPLALRFADPVDVKQLNETVSLLGPNGVVKTRVVAAEGGRLAFVQLPDELYPAARYTIFVQGLHTASGDAVPYEAVGFTTKAARTGVVLAGEGKRPGVASTEQSGEPPFYVMAGAGKVAPCKPIDAFHLCRSKGEVKDGAFYPGQDNVATASGGHWRLYTDRQTLPDTRERESNLPKGNTALIGQVRRIDESPVANVEITVAGQHVRTDAQGVFVLRDLLPGRNELFVDGGPAGNASTEYGRFVVGADVAASTVNHMPYVMYLPRVLARDKIALPSPTTHETVLTHPDMPGLELRIPAGAVFKDRNGKVLTEIAIVPTPVDHAPFPLPDNFPTYFTIQPGDAVVQGMTPDAAKGIQVVYPNYGKQKPADKSDFWVYSVEKGWDMYGAGHVSADASQLVSDKDTRLVWALGAGASANPRQPDNGKKPNNKGCGDPVDLLTGAMFEKWTDLKVRDVMPIAVDRTVNGIYNPSAMFGLGSGSGLSMTLSSGDGFVTPRIVLSCGEAIDFAVVAGQPAWPLVGTVWEHQTTNSSFYGTTLQFLNDSTPEGAHWVVSMPDSSQYWFERHAPNHMVRHLDKFGNEVDFSYNSGLLSQIVSPNGRSIRLHYNSNNLLDSATDDANQTVSYHYHALAGNPAQGGMVLDMVTFPDGTKEQYEYSFSGSGSAQQETWLLKSIEDRAGNQKLLNTFDSSGAVVTQTYADGSSLTFDYERTNGVTTAATVTDSTGLKERTEFDPVSLYPKSETRGYGTSLANTTTYVRDSAGLIRSRTDHVGRTTAYEYDSSGRVTKEALLAGTSEEVTTTYTYDGSGNVTSVVDSGGHSSQLTYVNGCLASSKDELGNTFTFTCSASGQMVTMQDPEGRFSHFYYAGGDLVGSVDPTGRAVRYAYDVLGRRTTVTGPSGEVYTTTYDTNSRPIRYGYPDRSSAHLTYSAVGDLTSVQLSNGSSRSYGYDAMRRLVSRTAADGKTESWHYENGMLASYTDRKGQATSYAYDELHRPVLTAYADGEGIKTTYDAVGRVAELLDSVSGSTSWKYDDFDRVLQVSFGDDWVKYGYDGAGRRTSMSTSGGASTQYGYDAADRVTSITQNGESVSMKYTADGNRSELVLPNGIIVLYGYDDAGVLTSLGYETAGSVKSSLLLSVNSDGRVDGAMGGYAGRVLPDASTADSSFDASNRQTTANGAQLSYDENGNLVFDGQRTYSWNARNQLTDVSEGGTKILSFRYNALGRRIAKVSGSGSETSYLYDGLNVVQEKVGSTTNRVFTGLDVDERFARDDTFGRAYFLPDSLGGTAALADAKGNVVRTYDYETFGGGNDGWSDNPQENPYRFSGRELDAPGLYYFRARYYSSGLKRFISEDPLGFGGGQLNFYTYVQNDPFNLVDPYGLADRAPSSFSWNRPPGRGGDYGSGLPLGPSQPIGGPMSPSQVPGLPTGLPKPYGPMRCVQGMCLVGDSCGKTGPIFEPMNAIGNGPGRYPETPYPGCVCTKWMSEDDIDPGGSGGASSADQWDAMDAATQLLNARRAQRQIQQEYQRELKD